MSMHCIFPAGERYQHEPLVEQIFEDSRKHMQIEVMLQQHSADRSELIHVRSENKRTDHIVSQLRNTGKTF